MIKQVPWSDEVDARLARALPHVLIRGIVAQEVRAGISQCWYCEEGVHAAYVVTRLDTNPTEWVVVAFEGTGMKRFGRLFVEAAQSRGITMRAHVTSPVVERLLRRLGLKREFGEVVLRTRAVA